MAQYKQQKPKQEHNFGRKVGKKSTAYYSCWACGLIKFNNEATRKAINKGCVDDAIAIDIKEE